MIISDGTTSITLRDPIFGEEHSVDKHVISRYTRGKTLKQLSDWPSETYLRYTFSCIKQSVVDDLKLFILANLGKLVSVSYNSYLNTGYLALDSLIITTQKDSCSYSFNLNLYTSSLTFECYLLAEDETILQSEYGDDFVLESCTSIPIPRIRGTVIRRGPLLYGNIGMHPYLGYWYNQGSRTSPTGRDSVLFPDNINRGYLNIKARHVITPLMVMPVSSSFNTTIKVRTAYADQIYRGYMRGSVFTPMGPQGVF